jgi:hypothetical protein
VTRKLSILSDTISRHPDVLVVQHPSEMTDQDMVPTGVFV